MSIKKSLARDAQIELRIRVCACQNRDIKRVYKPYREICSFAVARGILKRVAFTSKHRFVRNFCDGSLI